MVADVVGKLKLDTVPEVPVKYWRHPSGPVERKNIKKIFFFQVLWLFLFLTRNSLLATSILGDLDIPAPCCAWGWTNGKVGHMTSWRCIYDHMLASVKATDDRGASVSRSSNREGVSCAVPDWNSYNQEKVCLGGAQFYEKSFCTLGSDNRYCESLSSLGTSNRECLKQCCVLAVVNLN